MSYMAAASYKKFQDKLDTVTSNPFAEPRSVAWADFNRDGMLSMFGLARWSALNAKSILIGASESDSFGFVGTRHVTFDSIDECLYYANNTVIPLFFKYGTKLLGSRIYLLRVISQKLLNPHIGLVIMLKELVMINISDIQSVLVFL